MDYTAKSDTGKAAENWARYQYGLDRGHRDYMQTAQVLEGFYLGGEYDGRGHLKSGGHYNDADLSALREQRRPAYEFNFTKGAVEAAIGYQIANRMDIAFKPRNGDANKDVATVRSKLAMQIGDNNKLHWLETEVFTDGMIEQRGYLDVRMDFDDSILGELRFAALDPRDVIPDPDAKSANTKKWKDVTVTRWLTDDEIEGLWGEGAAKLARESGGVENDFGTDDHGQRNTFGSTNTFDNEYTTGGVKRYRVIDRQHYIRERMNVAIYPTGDVRQLAGDEAPEVLEDLRAKGATITKRLVNRVRWTISTSKTLLHDDWSPYDRFTVIPFFPYFRRGKTRGMVDAAVGPQLALDKAVSQMIHIVNSTANSGWQVEENQLTNMSIDELEDVGASTGLILERKAGTPALIKIQPNQAPAGTEQIIQMAMQSLKDVTVPDAMRGNQVAGESGILAQARQHAAQQILAVPLDNLSRFRSVVAEWEDYAITKYYDTERTFRTTKVNPLNGQEEDEHITVNQFNPETGEYLNDMTSGEYDIVVSEQPMQVTFENSQFTQIMEMRKEGIRIPDPAVIKTSNLTNKAEIIDSMSAQSAPPADPLAEAKAVLLKAQADKTQAETVNKRIESVFSATQAGGQIAAAPAVAPIADQLLGSAGFVDANSAPIVDAPTQQIAPVAPPQQNTSPLFPPRMDTPSEGMAEGIEGGN